MKQRKTSKPKIKFTVKKITYGPVPDEWAMWREREILDRKARLFPETEVQRRIKKL